MVNLSQKSRFPHWILWIVTGAAVLLIPVAFMAGWLADMGRVRPVLTQLSQAQQATMRQASAIPKEPPSQAPAHVVASWGLSQVVLKWSRVPGASAYVVYRAVGNHSVAGAEKIGEVTQSTHEVEFVDSGVRPGTQYTYWIAAVNAAGQGPMTQALSGETYLTPANIAQQVEKSAIPVQATVWSQGGLGLFAPTPKSYHSVAFAIDGVLYTALYLPPSDSHSTWLTKHWVSWTVGGLPVHVLKTTHQLTVLQMPRQEKSVTSLVQGAVTTTNVLVWYHQGMWQHQLFTGTLTNLPLGALVMNGYGNVIALTNHLGQLITIPSSHVH
ncbi:hypothetical protein SAMN00768000_2766 [Sulfobacillus thermosulfidooxidans DSM 9293]|uniref:Fibronectin type-III domain-containing protein n=2 Tax=Sulfobacillus thermosulfidooxidans TaxID=28034 RepID=A0A1W1WJC4_SULTA|nr:fibronectin type III domain-containing protein [Sulfobacillus thermosulfidooxidans]PSR27514.1 MAG: hypothetical protein C7B47_08105 [Sulfobacillus thermosulfidooxidans]SMC06345.1 hypothetical protein SAMN00768000_2766 [Sulfobacillus thermosulfidooxidans DSM 9293]